MSSITFGRRLLAARKGAKLSQRHVAEHFHIEKTTVSRWENDEYRPTLERIGELAEFFGESATWLAFGTGQRQQQACADVAAADVDDEESSEQSGEHPEASDDGSKSTAGAA